MNRRDILKYLAATPVVVLMGTTAAAKPRPLGPGSCVDSARRHRGLIPKYPEEGGKFSIRQIEQIVELTNQNYRRGRWVDVKNLDAYYELGGSLNEVMG
jgi:hypothetical protein